MKTKKVLRLLFIAQGACFVLVSTAIDRLGLGLLLGFGVAGIGWIFAGLYEDGET